MVLAGLAGVVFILYSPVHEWIAPSWPTARNSPFHWISRPAASSCTKWRLGGRHELFQFGLKASRRTARPPPSPQPGGADESTSWSALPHLDPVVRRHLPAMARALLRRVAMQPSTLFEHPNAAGAASVEASR